MSVRSTRGYEANGPYTGCVEWEGITVSRTKDRCNIKRTTKCEIYLHHVPDSEGVLSLVPISFLHVSEEQTRKLLAGWLGTERRREPITSHAGG